MKSGGCSDTGIDERQKILDSSEHHHRELQFTNRYLEHRK
jgi:hypothetical protein